MINHILLWMIFNLFVIFLLALDLFIFHRRAHVIKIREALILSAFWITLALLFNLGIFFWRGPDAALEFLTGYLIEKSLSVDNLFVFLLIFSYFRVPALHQHKILFWGILGALMMRAAFISMGISLIHRFDWIIYVFGAFLVFTGAKMMLQKGRDDHSNGNPIIRLCKRFMQITCSSEEGRFFIKRDGRMRVTPLFIVLVAIEMTDIVFAVDSIPAILAITVDPFIVYTSNVFAILGLRALYFALSGIMQLFHFLHYGLSVILIFVGGKMLLASVYKIPIGISLAVISGIIILSIVLSVYKKKNNVLMYAVEKSA